MSAISRIYYKDSASIEYTGAGAPPPLPPNMCDMEKVTPRDYTSIWIRYQKDTKKRSQIKIAEKYSISKSTINNWVKKAAKAAESISKAAFM